MGHGEGRQGQREEEEWKIGASVPLRDEHMGELAYRGSTTVTPMMSLWNHCSLFIVNGVRDILAHVNNVPVKLVFNIFHIDPEVVAVELGDRAGRACDVEEMGCVPFHLSQRCRVDCSLIFIVLWQTWDMLVHCPEVTLGCHIVPSATCIRHPFMYACTPQK